MFDLNGVEIDIPCPKCEFYNKVSFEQIRLRDVVICRGCKSNLQLDDYLNQNRNAVRDINRSVKDLENTINNMNLKIEL